MISWCYVKKKCLVTLAVLMDFGSLGYLDVIHGPNHFQDDPFNHMANKMNTFTRVP